MATISTFRVTDSDGTNAREISATSYRYDRETGRHTLYRNGKLVASLINVNIEEINA